MPLTAAKKPAENYANYKVWEYKGGPRGLSFSLSFPQEGVKLSLKRLRRIERAKIYLLGQCLLKNEALVKIYVYRPAYEIEGIDFLKFFLAKSGFNSFRIKGKANQLLISRELTSSGNHFIMLGNSAVFRQGSYIVILNCLVSKKKFKEYAKVFSLICDSFKFKNPQDIVFAEKFIPQQLENLHYLMLKRTLQDKLNNKVLGEKGYRYQLFYQNHNTGEIIVSVSSRAQYKTARNFMRHIFSYMRRKHGLVARAKLRDCRIRKEDAVCFEQEYLEKNNARKYYVKFAALAHNGKIYFFALSTLPESFHFLSFSRNKRDFNILLNSIEFKE